MIVDSLIDLQSQTKVVGTVKLDDVFRSSLINDGKCRSVFQLKGEKISLLSAKSGEGRTFLVSQHFPSGTVAYSGPYFSKTQN